MDYIYITSLWTGIRPNLEHWNLGPIHVGLYFLNLYCRLIQNKIKWYSHAATFVLMSKIGISFCFVLSKCCLDVLIWLMAPHTQSMYHRLPRPLLSSWSIFDRSKFSLQTMHPFCKEDASNSMSTILLPCTGNGLAGIPIAQLSLIAGWMKLASFAWVTSLIGLTGLSTSSWYVFMDIDMFLYLSWLLFFVNFPILSRCWCPFILTAEQCKSKQQSADRCLNVNTVKNWWRNLHCQLQRHITQYTRWR